MNKRIGFIRTGALGDVIQLTGIIREYKKRNPDKDIVISTVVPEVFYNNPNVSGIFLNSYNLTNVEKLIDLNLCYEKDPNKLAMKAYAEKVFGDSNFDMTPELFSTKANYESALKKLPSNMKRFVVIHMSRSWENRTWPMENYMHVVREVAKALPVIIVGNGGDFDIPAIPNTCSLKGRLSILEMREVLARASLFFGMDSGPLYVAQTTEVPIVGMYTCANPEYRNWRPITALIPKVDCKFCLHSAPPPVSYIGCPSKRNYECLRDIDKDTAVRACYHVLRQSGAL